MGDRNIVHVDMDAFYASVEQRDNPELKGKPVIVAWKGARSVVCAASYEARKYGVRSAMPSVTAERLCPQGIFIPPDFTRYREVSNRVREIFKSHTDLIEPLSLDEAYLDVTQNKQQFETPVDVAVSIRTQIREELSLTASAGVAPNKFLAKIASDWQKPDGLFVILPDEILEFLSPLPVGRLPGVGKVTEQKLESFGLKTVGDVRNVASNILEGHFGRQGRRLYELARGMDLSEVITDRPTQSISAEDTFERDILLEQTRPAVMRLAERVWQASQSETRLGRTVVLKLKTNTFTIVSRSHTPPTAPSTEQELVEIALWLLNRVGLEPTQLYRLVGVGLGNFSEPGPKPAQPSLFS